MSRRPQQATDPSAPIPTTASVATIDPLADLDELLNLEETYFAEGLARGKDDGAETGRREGRAFGLARGFERFAAMGRLHGRAVVWGSRLRVMEASQPKLREDSRSATITQESREEHEGSEHGHELFLPDPFATRAQERPKDDRASDSARQDASTPGTTETTELVEEELRLLLQDLRWNPMRHNPRLQKHVMTLYGLTEPESLSCENQEEAVAEFDDRFKRALTKAGIIGKIVGEEVDVEAASGGDTSEGHKAGGGAPKRDKDVGIEDVDILKVRH
jgi:hypothetical protein